MRTRNGLEAGRRVLPGAGAARILSRQRTRFVGTHVILAISAACTFVAATAAVHEMGLRRLSLESARWTEVAGTIVHSELLVHLGKTTSFQPSIAYRYRVDGQSFTGNRVLFASETSESTARDLVDRYPYGRSAIVWIRPGDPATSVLVRQSWDGWFPLGLSLFLSMFFGVLTGLSGVGSASAIRSRLRSARSTPPEPPLDLLETAGSAGPSVALGTLVEATDKRVVFARKRGGPGWRVGLAAVGAVAGPLLAPLAPMAWWVAGLAIALPAASLVLLYAALPELALGLSSLAPVRFGLRVERGDVDPYRGEAVYSGSIDGRPFGPDTRRALFDVRVGRLVAHVLVLGARAWIVGYAFGRRAAEATLRPIAGEASARGAASMADVTAALARTLHASKTMARPAVRLAKLRGWPLPCWLAARAVVYSAVAEITPLDPGAGLLFALGAGLTTLALETALVRTVLHIGFVPPLEALARELRAQAQG